MPISISANGASQAIYLDMSGSVMRYSIGTLTTPSTYTSFIAGDWPVTINNSNPGASTILKVVATQNLIITGTNAYYFSAGTTDITFDGSYNGLSSTITISGIGSWIGWIYSNNKSNIGVQNFTTASSGGSTLAGGWLCFNAFGAGGGATGCFITNCTNNANVTGNDCGGLCGPGVASNGGVVSITNCTNNGSLNIFNGGIIGTNCAQGSASSRITFTNCTNNGTITNNYCGGITGYNCATNGGTMNFINCTNNGTILGDQTGGICGEGCGVGSANGGGSVTFTNCVNTADISGNYAGGIAGLGISNNSQKASTMVNCYNVGNIRGISAGGLFGANLGSNSGTNTRVDISGCYSIANTISATGGGIIGGNNAGTYTNNPTINITNCYAYNYTTPANSIIVAASYPKPTTQTNCYIPTTGWSDASANSNLTGTPTNISTNNPGATWTMITAGTPYVLSAYNAALYSPNSASSSTNYTSAPGLFSPGYTYQLLYTSQAGNVATAQVFASKGTAPFYNSYNSNTFTFTSTNIALGTITSSINSSSGVLNFDLPNAPCFLEGSKILCFENDQEVYRPIESLRKGDLVKTIYNGYVPIHMIGTTSLYNPGNDYRVTNRLYKCSREKYPALFEDLYITGCHSILVPSMTDDQWENTKAVNGDIFVTDNHFRLIACADEKAEPFNKECFVNIYHVALEHNDYYMNYGIYANGLLVESCSKRYLTEISNMRILGQEDSAISDDFVQVSNNMGRQLVDTY